MKRFSGFTSLVFISLAAFAAVFAASHLKVMDELELATFDIRQIAFAPETKVSSDIVMVWLDEATMKELPYRSPVPRDLLRTLNDKILEAGPKLVGYDIFFKDPSFPNLDYELAASFSNGPVYAVMPMRVGGIVDMPLQLFREAVDGVGLADLPFNPFDSVVRTARFNFKTDIGNTPSFAALLYKAVTGNSAPESEMFIRFTGPPSRIGAKTNAFKVFSAQMVAKGLVPADWLRDKIVLVGAAYDDLTDAYLTPYFARFTGFARMNGVEIHANILSSLLTGQYYYTFESWQKWAMTAIIIILVSFAAAFRSPFRSALYFAGYILLLLVAAVASFKMRGVIVPVVVPAVGASLSYCFGVGWRALTEGRQRRWIKGVFAQYVPPSVVEHLIENPELIKLGGETRTVTSLFTDIASFTSISERLDPSMLVRFLNEYLSMINDILFKHGGTIDKYEGDAVIAFFNAPIEVSEHETAAVRSALEIQKASYEITKKWESICGRAIVTRVGINTGEAVVGNMGSNERFDYTAIGDTINLASRLEGANKFYGTCVMASDNTVKGLRDAIIVRPLDRVRVKGKKEPVLLYEIMGPAGDPDFEPQKRISEQFAQAFRQFEARELSDAEKILNEILRIYNEDGPSKELLARCKKAKEDPSWDLVTDLMSK